MCCFPGHCSGRRASVLCEGVLVVTHTHMGPSSHCGAIGPRV